MSLPMFKPMAYKPIFADFILYIMVTDRGGDTVVYSKGVCTSNDSGDKRATRSYVKYDHKGRPYFLRRRQKFYLSEFMRCKE